LSLSSIQIANLAISKVGDSSTIETFTENTAESKESNLWFDFSRQQALAAFNWSFARKRLTLSVSSVDARRS
jgi:hypothetical protein